MVPANSSALMSGVLLQFQAADLVAMDLVRPVGNPNGARVRVGACELEVVANACGTVGLDGPVEHLAGGLGRGDLDAGNLGARGLVTDRVHEPGSLVDQQARLIDANARLGDALERYRLLGERAAEGH